MCDVTTKNAAPAVEQLIVLNCQCGVVFKRPEKFQKYAMKTGSHFFKWKLKYCDDCFTKRSNKALKRLPEILTILATQ